MKHMKKSMFITTLIMTVVLVVALSTATFAWYTANTAVGSNATSVKTAASQTASLVVAGQRVTNANANNDTVSIAMTTNLAPMVYATSEATAPTSATTYGDFIASFWTMTQDSNGALTAIATTTNPSVIDTNGVTAPELTSSNSIFLSNVGSTDFSGSTATFAFTNYVYTPVDTSGFTNETNVSTYYILNASRTYELATGTYQSGTTYYSRDNGNNNMIVAIFAGAYDTADNNLTYKGMVSNLASVQLGDSDDIDAGEIGDDIATIIGNQTITPETPGDAISLGAIAHGSALKVKLVVWFEGDLMTNENSGTGATFQIDFAATASNS